MKYFFRVFLSLVLLFSIQQAKSQAFTFSVLPSAICYNPSGSNTVQAVVQATGAAAVAGYSWTIISPASCGAVSQTATVPNGSVVVFNFTCCGTYTINGFAYTSGGIPIQNYTEFATVICPASASITPSTPSNTVCTSTQMSLTASGMTTYTWTSSAGGGGTTTPGVNPLVISPTCFANYVVNGVTVAPTGIFGGTIACPVSSSINIFVQSATLGVGPINPTVCPTSPLCLTSTVSVPGGTCYVPGTATTSLLWYNPSGATVNPCTSPAAFGTYTAVLTHTGAAGSCSLTQAVNVFTSSTFPVTLTASSPSICPGGTVQLTAASVQTNAIGNFTWTQSPGFPATFTNNNNPITATITAPVPPRNFTVNVNYFGCTGQASITIGLLTLTPTLTPSSPSVCPSTSLNLLASGGTNYTITAIPFVSGGNTVISTGTNTSVNFTASAGQFPWQFAVRASSTGCTGSNTITIGQLVLNPQFTSTSYSVCPGTNFTLSSTGGAGTNYTFTSPPNTVLQTGLTNTFVHSAPSSTDFPRTYTVSVDSVGCKGSSTLTISELTLFPTVSLSSPSVCLGTSFCFTATGGAGTTYTYLAPTNTVPVTSSVVPKGALTDPNTCHDPQFGSPPVNPTYTLLVDSVGCKGSATFTVGIKDLSPNISMYIGGGLGQPTITTACPASQVTLNTNVGLNGSNYTYTYTIPGSPSFTVPTIPAGANTLNIGAPSTPAQFPATYTVQVDSAGCVGTQTITLNLRVLNPSVNSSTNSICANNVVTVCANPARALTLYSFIGVNASGTIGPVPSPPQPNPCQNFNLTQPTVFYVFADSAGCTNLNAVPPSSVLVSISQSLTIGATASPSIICSGQPSTLSVIGNSVYTYTWSAPSGTNSVPISTDTTAFVNPTISTTYTVNALDPVGCIGIQTVVLQVDPTASLSMVVSAPVTTICNSQGGPQQSTTLTAGGAVNYSWSPPTGLSNTSSSITIASPTAPLVYTVVGNNGLGCFGAAQITITSVSYPNILITANPGSVVCSGFNTSLTAQPQTGSTPITSYTWTGNTFSSTIVQPTLLCGPGTYTVIGSAGGSCTNTAVQSVLLGPNLVITPQAQVTGTTCITSNSPKRAKTVKLSATGAASYIWQPYDPLTMTYSLGANTDVAPHSTTCYTVTGLTSVCSGSAQICVTVVPQFTINVTPPNPAMCLGDSMKLSVVGIGPGAVGNQALYTYSWTDPAPISLDAPLSPTTTAFPISTITYSVDVADTRSCVSMPRLITVSVLPRPETNILLPIINNVPTNTICFVGESPGPPDVLLTLNAQNANIGLPFGTTPTFTWNSPNGTILTDRFLSQVTINAPYRLPSVVVYTVVSGYNGVQGCRSEDTVSVRIIDCRPITLVSFTTATKNDTTCVRDCITFMNLTDTLAGGPQQLSWTFEGGSPATSTLANPTICYNLPGKYNVILKVTNPYPRPGGSSGIKGTTEFVTIVDIPNVTIEPPGQLRSDTTIKYGESIVLQASGAFAYSWKPDYYITMLSGPVVTVSPLETTEYVVFGRNSQNCESSDTMVVYVEKECGDMFVPTAFSPNGDTHNDELFVEGICLESMTFMIFNRWGQKVFETTDQKKGWDGTFNEREMDTGVYFYRLEGKTFDGKGFSSKGNVTLLR